MNCVSRQSYARLSFDSSRSYANAVKMNGSYQAAIRFVRSRMNGRTRLLGLIRISDIHLQKGEIFSPSTKGYASFLGSIYENTLCGRTCA